MALSNVHISLRHVHTPFTGLGLAARSFHHEFDHSSFVLSCVSYIHTLEDRDLSRVDEGKDDPLGEIRPGFSSDLIL